MAARKTCCPDCKLPVVECLCLDDDEFDGEDPPAEDDLLA